MTEKTRSQRVLELIVGADCVIVLAAHGPKLLHLIEGDGEKLVNILSVQCPKLVEEIFKKVGETDATVVRADDAQAKDLPPEQAKG